MFLQDNIDNTSDVDIITYMRAYRTYFDLATPENYEEGNVAETLRDHFTACVVFLHVDQPSSITSSTTDEEIFQMDPILIYKEAHKITTKSEPDFDPVSTMDTDEDEIRLQVMMHRDSLQQDAHNPTDLITAFEEATSPPRSPPSTCEKPVSTATSSDMDTSFSDTTISSADSTHSTSVNDFTQDHPTPAKATRTKSFTKTRICVRSTFMGEYNKKPIPPTGP